MTHEVRVLENEDREAVLEFLARDLVASMHITSNVERYGLEDAGGLYQGVFLGAEGEDGGLAGVAQLVNQGSVLVASRDPDALEELGVHAAMRGYHPVRLLGREESVDAFRAAYAEERALPVRERRPALLLSLAPGDLRPFPLDGFRLADPGDTDLLVEWKTAFRVDAMGDRPEWVDAAVMRRAVEMALAEGRQYILEEGGRPVAITTLSALTETAAQLGGVYVPPEFRGKGYATRLVAGVCRDQLDALGRDQVVLSVDAGSAAARRVYEKIGFRAAGQFLYLLVGEG